MRTPQECQLAIEQLAARFGQSHGARAGGLDRSVTAHIDDLGLTYSGRLHDGVLDEIAPATDTAGQIRLAMSSDDLVAIAAGELSLGGAWKAGRVRVSASFPDLLRLRTLL
jgi:hypothetical protein